MKLVKFLFNIACIFLLNTVDIMACTSFSFTTEDKSVIAAKNYDWFLAHGHGGIYVYPRNSFRIAFTPKRDSIWSWFLGENSERPGTPLSWKSKYGSITFTQFGKGLPIGGMNEKGLVVEMLQLNSTVYPPEDEQKPAVNESQWALYQLDQFAAIQEVANHLHDLPISKAFIGIHYFLTDASGASAVVEYLNGIPTIYHGNNLPTAALSNDPYAELLSKMEDQSIPSSIWFLRNSTNRFATVAAMLHQNKNFKPNPVAYAFDILSSVCLNGSSCDAPLEPTQWSLVYDITNREILFKTRANAELRRIHLKDIDFDTLDTVKVLDMNTNLSGDLTPHFQDYSPEFNSNLVNKNSWIVSNRLRKTAIAHAINEGFFYPSP